MTGAAFDTDAAGAALERLGRAIADDGAYRAPDWDALTIVGRFDGGKSLFGYIYRNDGGWDARAPDSFDVLRRLADLRQAMGKPGAPDWTHCLVQVTRAGMKLHVEFDYGDGACWRIDPAAPEAGIETLRPR